MTLPEALPEFVARADGTRLAFRHQQGKGPTIVFLPGYMSDMLGSKALALAAWAAREDRSMLRLDYSGCGESDGLFEDGTLDIWRDDILAVIRHANAEQVVLVGSSMGGWLMLLVARALGRHVKAMVGIAAASDFTAWGFSETEKAEIAAHGRIERPSEYGYEAMVTTRAFWQSGEANRQLDSEIPIDCPVRLLHGQNDADVPWETSIRLAERLCSADVQTILIKDGEHRLSRDEDIALLIDVVTKLTG